eukprot:m.174830 g.174830  ORF g.174830 m.174830 type:complete len:627 (-) comp13879_c0_seq1:967-2847(-)
MRDQHSSRRRWLPSCAVVTTLGILLGSGADAVNDVSYGINDAHVIARRQTTETFTDVGCTKPTLRRIDCSSLELTEIPVVDDFDATKLELKNNSIHDGTGQLTAQEVANAANHPSLIELQMQSNGIATVAIGTFDNFPTLRVLRMFGNDLEVIEAGSFRGLTSLTTLYLNSNPLERLKAGAFDAFAGTLNTLFLQGCPRLAYIEDQSLNALTFRPLSLDMSTTASPCAVSPFDDIECVCEEPLTGDFQGFCEGPSLAPSTQAPVTSAPTPAPLSGAPTLAPTPAPTHTPTENPTNTPTRLPTNQPTDAPTDAPTTEAPTTKSPTQSSAPTRAPSTATPTTQNPTTSRAPTPVPTASTSAAPTSRAPVLVPPPVSAAPTFPPVVVPPPVTAAPVTGPPSTPAPSIAPDGEDREGNGDGDVGTQGSPKKSKKGKSKYGDDGSLGRDDGPLGKSSKKKGKHGKGDSYNNNGAYREGTSTTEEPEFKADATLSPKKAKKSPKSDEDDSFGFANQPDDANRAEGDSSSTSTPEPPGKSKTAKLSTAQAAAASSGVQSGTVAAMMLGVVAVAAVVGMARRRQRADRRLSWIPYEDDKLPELRYDHDEEENPLLRNSSPPRMSYNTAIQPILL